ncbi:hypothetical protein ACH4T9_13090 [Micromonospora sp. NPDC020750]|uniref:hypothetical protein n=1 Tax=unclassified Micromonospora TaxID=2617518 RepID=UPI00379C211A
MRNPKIDEDSQELTCITQRHKDMLDLKAKRQKPGHMPYGVMAILLGGAAVGVWGFILRDAYAGPPEPASRDYLAFLSFAIVLAGCAAAATFTWLITRVMQRQAGELDVLNQYEAEQRDKRAEQRANRIVNATIARLTAEGRRDYIKAVADQFKAETASILNSGGTATNVTPLRSRPGQRSS